MSLRWVSTVEIGQAEIVLQKLKEHNGEMVSAELFKELGVDKRTFMRYLNVLKRAGKIRFSDWYPYERKFHIKLVE